MATVACWALHGNINDAISYVLDVKNNGEKTENMYYECTSGNAYSAGYQWKINNEMNEEKDKSKNSIVGFHFRQSFEPGSISKDEAFEISKRWIDEILKGEYDYVITLHTDQKHIHSHIIVNPKNKKTGKQLSIFYKRDLPKYKVISDYICKENGLSTLDSPEGAGKSYYQWMMENKGDSLKDVISKSLDNLVNRVATYQELKDYLKAIGFEIEDDIDSQEIEQFTFTGDIKLVLHQDDEQMTVRLPYTSNYMKLENKDVIWKKENKTFQVTYSNDKLIDIYNKEEQFIKTIKAEELELNWEKKRQHHRKGLRIKVPSSKKFIRCNRIEKNQNNEGYSLDEILERIENNGRISCDPEIKEAIQKSLDKQNISEIKDKFYNDANIKEKWTNTNYYKKSKKERYIAWRTRKLQDKINAIHYDKEIMQNQKNYENISKDLKSLKKDYRELNDDIRTQESILKDIQIKRMENMLDITDVEIDEFVTENITPLYKAKKQLAEKIKQTEKMVKDVNEKKKEKDLSI